MAREQDILARPRPKSPPRLTSRRIGIHTSSAGGVQNAAERAYRLGCNTFQIFSSSPRQWAQSELARPRCDEMKALREKYDLAPLVIHTNYLVNLASVNQLFLKKSIEAFRGEIERALALCAEYLVLHPGSFRGADREQGLMQTAAAIAAAGHGLDLPKHNLTILIENSAGAEYSLGGSFEQVAEVLQHLRGLLPVAACIDTCHTHVSGYDIVSQQGMRDTLKQLDETVGLRNVRVWHCNDAKAARGSKLDRHQHVGKGQIGAEPFRWLLNDPRLAHAAFIAETPIDEPGDDLRNVEALKNLVKK
jgi:deoxyribonuclease-4